MAQSYHWLISGQVIAVNPDGTDCHRNLNSLLLTDRDALTRADLGKSQQALQLRFITAGETEKKAKIVDVFILSISYLGCMEPEVFHNGFDAPVEEPKT